MKKYLDLILGALFKDDGVLFVAVKDMIETRIKDVDRLKKLSGNLMEDIPEVYTRKGALDELKKIRSTLIEIESIHKKKQEE
jgi:hypothetical protein